MKNSFFKGYTNFAELSTGKKIFYIAVSAFVIGLIIYIIINARNAYINQSKYQTLLAQYIDLTNAEDMGTEEVYPSQTGNQISMNFWVRLNNVDSINNNSDTSINPIFFIDNFVYAQINSPGQTSSNYNVTFSIPTTAASINETVSVDIPVYTWSLVTMVLNNRNVDLYLNGKLVTSHLLLGIPQFPVGKSYKIVYGSGLFLDADVAMLQYFGRLLMPNEIYNLYYSPPNFNIIEQIKSSTKKTKKHKKSKKNNKQTITGQLETSLDTIGSKLDSDFSSLDSNIKKMF